MRTSHAVEAAPRFYARIAGVLYLIIIAGGLFAEVFVLERLVVSGDPAATAANILSHEMLYRLGLTAHVIVLLSALTLLFILYRLLKHVNASLAQFMVFFNLVSIAIESASLLYLFEPLVLLKSVSRFSALDPGQLQALAYAPLRLQSAGYDLALVFFGIFCIAIGALIWQSTFLPRIVGVLIAVAGLCYPINSFVHFLAPQHSLFPYILLPCFIGELALCLWLMAKGVNLAKWEETVSAARLGGA